ncbi:PST family polysaccharide transporter [Pedobacter sp. CAN_A7]|uniref:MOP flippase family protein n=1 Tax=Pedobacter sp. CAN_A7 TaxID=2787722 RepID=UPI0018CAE634
MVSIKKVILNGLFWSILNQFSVIIVGLVITGFLARLISPSEFGILGMVSLSTGFLNVLKDFGFGAALIQKKTVTDEEYSTVFWFNLIIGAFLALVVFFAAPLLGQFFKEEKVVSVSRVLSFTFVINSLGIVWNNRLVKDVAFKQIFYRTFLSTIISGIIGVFLAFKGYGIWALVAQMYMSLIINTILNYLRVRWLPQFVFSRNHLKELWNFGLPLLGDQIINYWVRNIDNILIGRVLGKDSLAFYNKGYSLMLLPVRQLTGTLTKVLFPSFSMIQDDKGQIGNIYLKMSSVIAFIAFPLMICLSMLAEPLILIVYGENWKQVIPIFQVLSILGMFQALGSLSGNIYLSLGETKLMFKIGLFSRAVMIFGIVCGLYAGGIMGLVYGYCIASGLAFLPELYFIGKLLNISLKRILLNFLPYLMLAALTFVVIRITTTQMNLGLLVDFILKIVCFSVLYLILNFMLKTKALSDLLLLVRKKQK